MKFTLLHRVVGGAVLPVAAVLFSFTVYLLWWQQDASQQGRLSALQNLSAEQASSLELLMQKASRAAQRNARLAVLMPELPTADYWRWFRWNLEETPEIYGNGVTFWPANRGGKRKDLYALTGPFGNHQDGRYWYQDESYTYDGADGTHAWFEKPRQLRKPVWSEPYFDEGSGNTWMVTYSIPFYRQKDETFDGVAFCDIPITALQQEALRQHALEGLYAVVTPGGRFVFHHEMGLAGKTIADWPLPERLRSLLEPGAEESGAIYLDKWPGVGPVWVTRRTVPGTEWVLLTAVADPAVLGGWTAQQLLALLILLCGLLIAGGTSLWLTRRYARPIEQLTLAAQQIAGGKRAVDLPRRSRDEVGALAVAFEDMQIQLSVRDQALRTQQGELEQLNRHLESRVESRTQELETARRKAADASAAKSSFLATVSHELRTPMNAIIGLSSLTLETTLDTQQRDWVGKIHRSSTVLLALINDVLDFSRIEAGKMTVERIAYDPTRVVSMVMDMQLHRAQEKRLRLTRELAADLPVMVMGDPLRVSQVLMNLVGNAIKFTDMGDVTVLLEMESGEAGGERLRFTVRDTGSGLSPEQLTHLFLPFSQVDASTTRRHAGAGLGLAISRQLVEIMGGQIGVESEPGRGSVFWFWLPLQRADSGPPVALVEAPELSSAAVPETRTSQLALEAAVVELLLPRLQAIQALLEQQDGAAVDVWLDLLREMPEINQDTVTADVQQQLSLYDFEQARRTLAGWVQYLQGLRNR